LAAEGTIVFLFQKLLAEKGTRRPDLTNLELDHSR